MAPTGCLPSVLIWRFDQARRQPNYDFGMPTLRFPALAYGVVVLRRWQDRDIGQQLIAFSDPVFRHFSDWAPTTESEALRRLLDQDRAWYRGEQIDFAVAGSGDLDTVLGGASLNNVELHESRASLGYWLAPMHEVEEWPLAPSGSLPIGLFTPSDWHAWS